MSAVTKRGFPMATTRISAERATEARSAVRLCAMVTVAFSSSRSFATGRPTMLLLPITTALFPAICTPAALRRRIMPFGVQATVQGCFCHRAATFRGWNPSTSFSFEMVSMTFASLMCLGRGSWTRMPSTESSSFSSRIRASSSSSVIVSGLRMVVFFMPVTSQAFALPVT